MPLFRVMSGVDADVDSGTVAEFGALADADARLESISFAPAPNAWLVKLSAPSVATPSLAEVARKSLRVSGALL